MSASKKARLDGGHDSVEECTSMTAIESLSTDEVASVFEFLGWRDILRARVCRKFRDAARIAPVRAWFEVGSDRSFRALAHVAGFLPNLRRVTLGMSASLGRSIMLMEDGEDPDNSLTPPPPWEPRHSFDAVASFRNLQVLAITGSIAANGRYPSIFTFAHLKELALCGVDNMKVDLEMLSGCPILEALTCYCMTDLKGDLKSLAPLKTTLRSIEIFECFGVTGNFMHLADFAALRDLDLDKTSVVGDVLEIRDDDFPMLEKLSLPHGVHGGGRGAGGDVETFERVADVPEVMRALCRLEQRNVRVVGSWMLARSSQDRYAMDIFSLLKPPFFAEVVRAGPRVGWRWTNKKSMGCCETNWVGREPSEKSGDYAAYKSELEAIQANVRSFRGFFKPPTQEEYQRLSTHW